MEQRSIREIAAWAGGQYEGPDLPVAGVRIDSRSVAPGDLFVALRGKHKDGHEFLGEAFASGAAAALVERKEIVATHRGMGRAMIVVPDVRRALGAIAARYRRALGFRVAGVTGSVGKTTTKEMLRLALGAGTAASPESFNNDLGVPLTLLGTSRTDAVCVVEIGTSGPGEIAALAALAAPDVAVVLNVGESHLERLGNLEGVAREKCALVESLGREGCAVLNDDDPRTRAMMRRAPGPVLTFGMTPRADVYGDCVRAGRGSVSFQLFRKTRVRMSVFGTHHVPNALAAAAVALWLGRPAADVAERLSAFRPAPMRMAVEAVGGTRLILDAYNANPRSAEAAVRELGRAGGSGRRILVLGDMLELGTRAPAYHERLGRIAAASGITALWAIGPLSEATARGARDAGLGSVFWSADVEEAIAHPPIRPRTRDVVLFKASRAMRLERLHAAIKEAIGARSRARPASTARSGETLPA
ncbi:MAG: UDP-N-acetylmuramoyl-tripeptide--D-alanyl-D-alanine ligase [Planctomycetaceae bacterium]